MTNAFYEIRTDRKDSLSINVSRVLRISDIHQSMVMSIINSFGSWTTQARINCFKINLDQKDTTKSQSIFLPFLGFVITRIAIHASRVIVQSAHLAMFSGVLETSLSSD